MNKLILVIVLFLAAASLFAQAGLFNLSYALPMAEADSLLALSGFKAKDSGDNMVRYFPENNPLISAIIVFVEPKTNRMIGWFIKYSPENTEENDSFVLETLQNMHGKSNQFDEETQQLIWHLSTTRTVHVLYADDKSLTVLYYDSFFPELFKLHKEEAMGKSMPVEPVPPIAETPVIPEPDKPQD